MPAQTVFCRYAYDPLDRLASRTLLAEAVTQRFYNEGQLATEIKGPQQRTYLRASTHLVAQKDDHVSTLLATDQHDSVLHANDTAIAYAPYGHRQQEGLPCRLPGFNGQQPDPGTGHYLLGNGYRAYNPVLMRFNSPDSLSPFGNGGVNAYAYCSGDPVNLSDPTGHIGGLVGLTSRMLVSQGRKGVARLESIGNRIHEAFRYGLNGGGAVAAGRAFATPAGQGMSDFAFARLRALPALDHEMKAKSAVLKAFSTRNQAYRASSGKVNEDDYFDVDRLMNLRSNNRTLAQAHPRFSMGKDGFNLGRPEGQAAVRDFQAHATQYLGPGGPMDSIARLGGGTGHEKFVLDDGIARHVQFSKPYYETERVAKNIRAHFDNVRAKK